MEGVSRLLPLLTLTLFSLCLAVPKDGSLRLENLRGFRAEEAGNLLVYRSGRWGPVCDDGWTIRGADVACKQLGYDFALSFTSRSFFGTPSQGIHFIFTAQCLFMDKLNTNLVHVFLLHMHFYFAICNFLATITIG